MTVGIKEFCETVLLRSSFYSTQLVTVHTICIPAKSMSFALFNLPYLTLENVLKQTTLREKFILSLVSKRTQRLIRACVAREKFRLCVSNNEPFFLVGNGGKLFFSALSKSYLFGREPQFNYRYSNNEVVGFETDLRYESNLICTYWEDVTKRTIPLIKFLFETFNKLELQIVFDLNSCRNSTSPEDVPKMIKLIKTIGVPITEVKVYAPGNQNDVLLKSVFKECRNIPELILGCKVSSNFVYCFPEALPFKFDTILMLDAGWIQIGHVLSLFMNCKSVYLHDTRFSDFLLVQIFKRWSNGCKMEYFRTDCSNDNISGIANQLGNTVSVQKAIIDNEIREFAAGQCFTFSSSAGKLAIVHLDYDEDDIVLRTEFEIIHG